MSFTSRVVCAPATVHAPSTPFCSQFVNFALCTTRLPPEMLRT